MTDAKFLCPHCGQSLEAPADMIGLTTNCPKCNMPIMVTQPQKAAINVTSKKGCRCSSCGEHFTTSEEMIQHVLDHHKPRGIDESQPDSTRKQNGQCSVLPFPNTASPRAPTPMKIPRIAKLLNDLLTLLVPTQRMKVIASLLIGLLCGYFLGREHVKYEIRNALRQTFAGIGDSLGDVFGQGHDAAAKSKVLTRKPRMAVEVAAYTRDSMAVYDIGSEYRNTTFDGRVAVVFGKVKNNGSRTLTSVHVTAYFLDLAGKVIFENSYPAVFTGGVSGDTPLRPNYIKEFAFRSKDCPSEWQEGEVRLAITDLEFE